MVVSTCCEAKVVANYIGSYPIKKKPDTPDITITELIKSGKYNNMKDYFIMSEPDNYTICCACNNRCETKTIIVKKIIYDIN